MFDFSTYFLMYFGLFSSHYSEFMCMCVCVYGERWFSIHFRLCLACLPVFSGQWVVLVIIQSFLCVCFGGTWFSLHFRLSLVFLLTFLDYWVVFSVFSGHLFIHRFTYTFLLIYLSTYLSKLVWVCVRERKRAQLPLATGLSEAGCGCLTGYLAVP